MFTPFPFGIDFELLYNKDASSELQPYFSARKDPTSCPRGRVLFLKSCVRGKRYSLGCFEYDFT